MKSPIILKDLLAKECVLAPCVYDCASARAVELSGFKAMMLSGAELSMAMKGLPDLGLLNLDELAWAVTRITDVSPLPLTVDIGDGFGSGPLHVFNTCERMIKAGAQGVLLEDESEPGYAKGVVTEHLLPRQAFYNKVKAMVAACKGTNCITIARTNVDLKDLDEGIARCLGALELGADMTVIVRLNNLKDAQEISRRVPGWKMYPDLNPILGLPEVTAADFAPLGFNFVTMHYLLKTAMAGMIDAGRQNVIDQSNIYSNKILANGFAGHSAMPMFGPKEWLKFEAQFTGEAVEFLDPSKKV